VAEPLIVATARSPIGKAHKGALVSKRADDLAAEMVRAALAQVPQLDVGQVDDLILGCALPGGEQGFNMARAVAVLCGYDELPGVTVNRFCASSAQGLRMAAHAIRAGEARAVVVAGAESVSRLTPDNPDSAATRNPILDNPRDPAAQWRDPRLDGLAPNFYIDMGTTAENVAKQHGITRRDMDLFALESQRKTEQARQAGFWDEEITPVHLQDGTMVTRDDGPRPTTTMEALANLQPVFDPAGTITAGNACGVNDGAAAVVVMSDEFARELAIEPLARIVATGVSGLSPEIMGLGPIEATRRALAHAGLTIDDMDQVEINEAFAAQVIPCQRELHIPDEKLNVNGGGIALGHPYGMTGARIANTLLHSLRARDQQFGLETMCVAGGQGMAIVFERL
jgi:acetyl-CoA C-acetyltransferase